MNNVDVWRGAFGDSYIGRNQTSALETNRRAFMWERIMRSINPASILEVGANIGLNLTALGALTDAELYAVEPNAMAREQLVTAKSVVDAVFDGTVSGIPLGNNAVDMVFTCGVLIHVPPDDLGSACDEIYRVASKHIVCIEYFSAEPVEVPYRGLAGMLWKRDFGDFWMDRHDLMLVDHGFFWKRATGIDNLHFWVFEK